MTEHALCYFCFILYLFAGFTLAFVLLARMSHLSLGIFNFNEVDLDGILIRLSDLILPGLLPQLYFTDTDRILFRNYFFHDIIK